MFILTGLGVHEAAVRRLVMISPNGAMKSITDGVEYIWGNDPIRLIIHTPPQIIIEPENGGLEDDFPFPGVYSQVPC